MQTKSMNPAAQDLTGRALAASARGESEEAIACLKRAAEADARAGAPRYLLGAEYAQLGLYDRAIEEMSRAVEIEPALGTARLQLGLLHLTSGRVAEALEAWEPLAQLSEEDPLRWFQAGLSCLAADRLADARAFLEGGIQRNPANPPLNRDMEKIIAQLVSNGRAESAADATSGEHVLVSGYLNR